MRVVEADLEAGVKAAGNRVTIGADAALAVKRRGSVGGFANGGDGRGDRSRSAIAWRHAGNRHGQFPGAAGPQFELGEEPGLYRILQPDLPAWRDVIDEGIRLPALGGQHGPMRQLAFGPEPFVRQLGALSVFLPRRDAVLLHLAHPMMQRALGMLARRRYPGNEQVSRWTVRRGGVPAGAGALVLLSVEELAVNKLREMFHRWVRTVAFPVQEGFAARPDRTCTRGCLS